MTTIDNQTQQQVLASLSWTKEQYNQFIYDCGLLYLAEYLPDYPQIVEQITRSQAFWKWWVNHWESRDLEFLETIEATDDPVIDPEAIFKAIHDPELLATDMYLNGQVLQETYATLIPQITKEQEVSL